MMTLDREHHLRPSNRFALVRERWWHVSPTTHINERGPAFIPPVSWPAWVWKECACKFSQMEMFVLAHVHGELSEGQAAKATGLDRVTLRKLADEVQQ